MVKKFAWERTNRRGISLRGHVQEIMNRRRFLHAALATSVGSFLFQNFPIQGATAEAKIPKTFAGGFETIGLYC